MESLNTRIGNPNILGAVPYCDGVNFAVYSKNAQKVVLDLFDSAQDKQPARSIEFDSKVNKTGSVWHIFVEGLSAGALYLYRVDGPYNPPQGHRFNFNKYLLDPYAKALTNGSVFYSYNRQREMGLAGVENGKISDLSGFPKCVVIDDTEFDWQGDKPLNYPMYKSIIYETHLKGYTASETAQVSNPGTFKGFCEKIPYLKELGITAVEFMPIFEFDENENNNVNPKTGERLKNYWGYSPMSFFSPKTSYSSDKTPGGSVRECKEMIRQMHSAGIEVILDVVFNHTAEGNEHGYTFSFRGFENSTYYMLPYDQKQYYMNFSGCGNTVNVAHPVVTNLILDSLRYWVSQMHVDGFRFDLAAILCRDENSYLQIKNFLTRAISEDAILQKTKIIAEPWDCGGGYLVGGYPGGRWSEWNDRYRNDIRRFVRGDEGIVAGAATRIAGSSDLYNHSERYATASINFITAHDGFTLNDVVSYNTKHNDENGEGNRDGTDDNNCYNHGFEGVTVNPKIENLRTKKIKNHILCLLISQGVPMLLAGDEFRRTQMGNNNAYCQDNEISWVNWNLESKNKDLVTFVKRMITLRKTHPVFQRETFFSTKTPEIEWFDVDGKNPDWNAAKRFIAFKLDGTKCLDCSGNVDNDFYIAGNTDIYDVTITLPSATNGKKWHFVADTSIEGDECIVEHGNEQPLQEQKFYILPAGSFVILMGK
ncbi:MAG: glycogen debranching protein GlgX [Treponemataceae bacterium]|nr:glycogen debranching protein GlgX [Treponemataceae bacterium]